MFSKNGAVDGTLIRGFGTRWEQPLSAILNPQAEIDGKASVRERLKATTVQSADKHKKAKQQER